MVPPCWALACDDAPAPSCKIARSVSHERAGKQQLECRRRPRESLRCRAVTPGVNLHENFAGSADQGAVRHVSDPLLAATSSEAMQSAPLVWGEGSARRGNPARAQLVEVMLEVSARGLELMHLDHEGSERDRGVRSSGAPLWLAHDDSRTTARGRRVRLHGPRTTRARRLARDGPRTTTRVKRPRATVAIGNAASARDRSTIGSTLLPEGPHSSRAHEPSHRVGLARKLPGRSLSRALILGAEPAPVFPCTNDPTRRGDCLRPRCGRNLIRRVRHCVAFVLTFRAGYEAVLVGNSCAPM
jgi:hypothetical protein